MLSDDHIFVRLTRKYCDINQIKKEVSSTTIVIDKIIYPLEEIISHLIKSGKHVEKKDFALPSTNRSSAFFEGLTGNLNFTYIKASIFNDYECDLCENSHVCDLEKSNNLIEGLQIKFDTETSRHQDLIFGIQRVLFIWGDCTKYIYPPFNEIVSKLGRIEFKKLYFKLFIFFSCNENIVFDLQYIIGEYYILLNL